MMPPLNDPDFDALSEEIKDVVYDDYYLAKTIKKGNAYHMGSLPAALRVRVEELFRQSFSNYFMAFLSAYKDFIGQEAFGNDWYEYVEYGSVNPLTIMLQRNGFSREAATYITENRGKYVSDTVEGQRLRRSLLACKKTMVQREAQLIEISMPELYLKEKE